MISITIVQERYYPKSFIFPGGEVNVSLPGNMPYSVDTVGGLSIKAIIKSSDDLMELLLVKSAIDVMYGKVRCTLKLPYVPYGRQDRACNEGEALSIKVLAGMINSMSFHKVLTYDNHSDVSTALINNCMSIKPERIMAQSSQIKSILGDLSTSICCPDAGAAKKIYGVSKAFGGIPIIMADKVRDTATGDITHTSVNCDDLGGRNIMVVDDICDGGFTFIKLAEKLKEKGAGMLFLYVTHGIFSKGLEVLDIYDQIFTTDSFASTEDMTDKLTVIKI